MQAAERIDRAAQEIIDAFRAREQVSIETSSASLARTFGVE